LAPRTLVADDIECKAAIVIVRLSSELVGRGAAEVIGYSG